MGPVSTSAIVHLSGPQRDTDQDQAVWAALLRPDADDWIARVGQARERMAAYAEGVPAIRSLTVVEHPAMRSVLLGTDLGDVTFVRLSDVGPRTITLDGVDGPLAAINCGQIAGRPVAVLIATSGERKVLDLQSGRLIKTGAIDDPMIAIPSKRASGLTMVEALTMVDWSLVKIFGLADGRVLVQDDRSRETLPQRHAGGVTAVACQYLNGQPLAFTGGQDGKVRVWDLATRRLVDVIDVTGPVFAIEATADGDLIVGAGGEAILFRHASAIQEGQR
jgi:hypothetical protein